MPNNGQLIEPTLTPSGYGWDELIIKCGSVASVTSDDPDVSYGHNAGLNTDYCEDALVRLLGITLSASSSFDGTSGVWSVEYDGPAGPVTTGAAVYRADVSIEVRIPDFLLYARLTGSLLTSDMGTAELWVNGSFHANLTSFGDTSTGVGPQYIKQIGIPAALTGSCSIGSTYFPTDPIDDEGNVGEDGLPPGFTYDPCDPAVPDEEATSEITSTVYGGWRFLIGATYYDLPVSTNVPDDAGDGPFGLSPAGIITTTRTWGNHISCRDYRHYKFEYLGRENPTETSVQVTCDGVVVRTDTNASSGNSCIDDCTGLPGPYYRDLYKVTYDVESAYGSIRLIPNLERAMVRLGDDHASDLYRYPFPEVRSQLAHTYRDGEDIGSDTTNTTVLPSLSEFKEVVDNTLSDFEEPLGYTAHAEVYCQRSQGHRVGFTPFYTEVCTCPWDWFVLGSSPCVFPQLIGFLCGATWPTTDDPVIQTELASFQFPSYVEDGSIGGVLIGGPMYHADDLTRYFSTWCHPLWLMYYWTVEKYEVDGAELRWMDYWGNVREQWFQDTSQQRNSIIATFCEDENGHTPFLDTYTAPPPASEEEEPNNGLRWIGVSRFKLEEFTVPVDLTLSTTRPAEWAARVQDSTADCSVTLGAGGITLDDFEVAEAWVDCSLCNWDTDPYLLLAIFQKVTLDWELTNVDSMEVVLVGWDESETPLMTTPSTVDVKDLAIVQSKYAGSWAIDNGGGAVTDTGTDTLAAGMSAATMTDYPSRAMAFQLGMGRSWRYLRFKVTPIDTGLPVVIEWPYFQFPTAEPAVFWESGKCAAIIWPEGPGIRWGAIQAYDLILGFMDPPLTTGLGVANTMIDTKVFGRRLLQGDGGATISTTITSELGDLVDSFEGPASISVVDKFSLAFPLPFPVE